MSRAFPSSNISSSSFSAAAHCDLCGNQTVEFVLTTPRLDGPLVRCRACGLYFVVKPASEIEPGQVGQDSILSYEREVTLSAAEIEPSDVGQDEILSYQSGVTLPSAELEPSNPEQAEILPHELGVTSEMERLAARARELALVEPHVEQSETPWRIVTAQERLRDLQRFVKAGRLLEIGCATGEMLTAAQSSFSVTGIEADAHTSAAARARGLHCLTGSLFDAQLADASFDVIALYHVIEHWPSPQAVLHECARLLAPGGWLVLEAPNIQNFWYRLLGARWRQFIPDHLFFFTPATLQRLCAQNGLRISECRSVGKAMSARLFISRVGRYSPRLAQGLSAMSRALQLDEATLRLKLGDVMRLYAQKP